MDPPMPNPEQKPVEVIQADREMAASMYAKLWRGADEAEHANIISGQRDDSIFVQAFARHRLSHAAPVPREPTERMKGVGGFTKLPVALTDIRGDPYAGSEGAAAIWRAMYDAAPAAPRMSGDLVERLRTAIKLSQCSGGPRAAEYLAASRSLPALLSEVEQIEARAESDADLIRRLVEEIARIADDYHPDQDIDAPQALQEMRDALTVLATAKQGEGRS